MNKFDIPAVAETNRRCMRMMKIMHKALRQIVVAEHGLDGGITAQAIARDALVEAELIAQSPKTKAQRPMTEAA